MSYSIDTVTLYNAILENTGQAFFAYDTNARQFRYLSPAFLEIFQLGAGDPNVSMLLEKVNPEDREHVAHSLDRQPQPGQCVQVEFRIQLPNQRHQQWVCLNASLLENSDERLVIGHAEDISASRHYNDYLKKFSDKKNSVLNILAHDLAAPMGMISSLAEILKEQLGPEADAEALHIISLIERGSRQGTTLISEFINREFLESSQTAVIKRRVNLTKRLEQTLEEYQSFNNLPKQKHVFFHSGESEIYAEIDDNKFMQVINNLISNALKFTPEGGQVNVRLAEDEDKVLVEVADNGVGIPKKHHDSLFDQFTKARRPGLNGEPSVGLGMSIIKDIVEWHGGQITFESEEGKGTTFKISLPK